MKTHEIRPLNKKCDQSAFRKSVVLTAAALILMLMTAEGVAQDAGIVGNARKMEPVRGSWNPLRYEEGYVLGVLSQVASKGVIIKTLEGQVKLGVTSAQGGLLDQECFNSEMSRRRAARGRATTGMDDRDDRAEAAASCTELINPWHFSGYKTSLLAGFEPVAGNLALVFYRAYWLLPILGSHNYFAKVYLVEPEILPVGSSMEASMPIASHFHYGSGYVEGRIVKAALDGVIRKAYELVIQVGPAGDLFKEISVSDEKLFNFGLKAMSTGRYLRIGYYQLYSPYAAPMNLVFGYNTDLRARSIEVIADPRLDVLSPQMR